MIGRTNAGGGGGGLNFKVVGGTTQPENPKENTIWVNTETEITSWSFSATEPESPVEGMVWIATGTSSTVEFNALKKNGIQVYPISAKQYISGAWVSKTATSYQSGSWVDWAVFLYNEGDECTDLTGGWTAYAYKSSNSGSKPYAPTLTKGEKSMTISLYSAHEDYRMGSVFAENVIDLTNYKYICVNVTAMSIAFGFGVVSAKTNNYTFMATMRLSVGLNKLDISSLSGSQYICFMQGGHGGNASVTIDKVYMQ